MLAIVPKRLLQTGEDDNRGSQFKFLKEQECIGGVAVTGQNAAVVLVLDCQAVYRTTPLHLLYDENAMKGIHIHKTSQPSSVLSLDRWVAEAPMMATLPYSQTGLAKDL